MIAWALFFTLNYLSNQAQTQISKEKSYEIKGVTIGLMTELSVNLSALSLNFETTANNVAEIQAKLKGQLDMNTLNSINEIRNGLGKPYFMNRQDIYYVTITVPEFEIYFFLSDYQFMLKAKLESNVPLWSTSSLGSIQIGVLTKFKKGNFSLLGNKLVSLVSDVVNFDVIINSEMKLAPHTIEFMESDYNIQYDINNLKCAIYNSNKQEWETRQNLDTLKCSSDVVNNQNAYIALLCSDCLIKGKEPESNLSLMIGLSVGLSLFFLFLLLILYFLYQRKRQYRLKEDKRKLSTTDNNYDDKTKKVIRGEIKGGVPGKTGEEQTIKKNDQGQANIFNQNQNSGKNDSKEFPGSKKDDEDPEMTYKKNIVNKNDENTLKRKKIENNEIKIEKNDESTVPVKVNEKFKN